MARPMEQSGQPAGQSFRPSAMGRIGALIGWRDRPLFYLMVVLPGLVAAIYYLFIASPVYVSEARFIVRAAAPTQASSFNLILQNVGLGQAETDAFAVHEYVMSRNAIADLEQHHHLRAVLARPGADFMARFPRLFQRNRFEDLFKAYKRFVDVGYDSTTGISTLKVKAFRPGDAQEIAQALLDGGEGVINTLNVRAQRDDVTEATRQVADDQIRVSLAQQNLTAFRNHEQLIDPIRSSAVSSELVAKLNTELATLKAERAGLAASAAQSPQLAPLDRRIEAYAQQIAVERSRIAGESGSLAPKIATYEQLMLDREFSDKTLASAMATLEAARIEARRKRLYLERVVTPTVPDAAIEPRRFRALALVLISCLLAYGATILVIAGFREHRQA
jgi:capsular polysaccharide transport system permease protein